MDVLALPFGQSDMEPAKSPAAHLWNYLRTKSQTAWWVLRKDGPRAFWRGFTHEVSRLSGRYTKHQRDPQDIDAVSPEPHQWRTPEIADSAFVNSRKVLPPSSRPTRLRVTSSRVPDMDRAAIGQAILRIKSELRRSSTTQGKLSHDDQ